MVILETKIDLCRIVKGVRSSVIAKVLFANAIEASSGDLSCPTQAGNYTFTNNLITNAFLPPFPGNMFPSGVVEFFIKATVKGVLMTQMKKYLRLYDFTVFGTAFNSDMFNTTVTKTKKRKKYT